MNVINTTDLDREINRVAAHIVDPRAAKWFKKVARYWTINMDQLAKPYSAQAEPRSKRHGGRPADFYTNPKHRGTKLLPSFVGKPPEEKSGTCKACQGKGSWVEWPNGFSELHTCPKCHGSGGNDLPSAGDTCPSCKGSGKQRRTEDGLVAARPDDPNAVNCENCNGTGNFAACPDCNGSGEDCLTCHGTGRRPISSKGREGFHMGEALRLVRLALALAEANEGYDPTDQTYSTTLHYQTPKNSGMIECPYCMQKAHEPGVRRDNKANPGCKHCHGTGQVRQRLHRDLAANFDEYDPKKAKKTGHFSDPPSKDRLEPWMTSPSAAEKKFHFFRPAHGDVIKRDYFNRMQEVAQYLNFVTRDLTLSPEPTPDEAESLNPEEFSNVRKMRVRRIEMAKEAIKLIEKSMANPEDPGLFKALLSRAEEWANDVRTNPGKYIYGKGGRILVRYDDMVLRKTENEDSALACGNKAPIEELPFTWCLRHRSNIVSYLGDGPIYYIEKNGHSFVGVHPASKQCRNVNNNNEVPGHQLPAATSREIAPMLAACREIDLDSIEGNAPVAVQLARELRRNP